MPSSWPYHSRGRALGLDGFCLLQPWRAGVEASLSLSDALRRLVIERAAGYQRCREQSKEHLCQEKPTQCAF